MAEKCTAANILIDGESILSSNGPFYLAIFIFFPYRHSPEKKKKRRLISSTHRKASKPIRQEVGKFCESLSTKHYVIAMPAGMRNWSFFSSFVKSQLAVDGNRKGNF